MRMTPPTVVPVQDSTKEPVHSYAVTFDVYGVRRDMEPMRSRLVEVLTKARLFHENRNSLLLTELPDPESFPADHNTVEALVYGDYMKARQSVRTSPDAPNQREPRETIWPMRISFQSRAFDDRTEAQQYCDQLAKALSTLSARRAAPDAAR